MRQHATQGSLSLTASGAAWWVSFDWFDAEVLCRDFMSWRLEDRDTDEVSAFYAPGDAPSFVTWRAVPSPRQLAASASAGGSHAFADPEHGISFAYVMNQMEPGVLPGPKALRLIDALYA